MRKLLLVCGISLTATIFPCEMAKEMIDEKYEEVVDYLHKFDHLMYATDPDEIGSYEMYWHTVGRFEALQEMRDELSDSTGLDSD